MFTFPFLNDKIYNYVQKTHNCEFYFSKLKVNTLLSKHIQTKQNLLSKTDILFSHFEGTRGEKTKIFRTLEVTGAQEFHASARLKKQSNMEFKNEKCKMGSDSSEYSIQVKIVKD